MAEVIDPVATIKSPEELGITVGEAGGAMGKDEFLKLLAVQLQSQDPLDPMKNTEMIAQLAQFSALEQMQNLNTQFTSMSKDIGLGMVFSMAGQNVKIGLTDGTTVEGTIEKASLQNGKIQFDINGQSYTADLIQSISRLEETPAEPTPAG